MLFTLLNSLITELGLDHQGLADVMGVKLQRVRDLASGRAKKLTREESAALIQKLGVRADWLITGEGAMLGRDETQDEFVDRQQAINRMHKLINAMPLSEFTRGRLCATMTGDPALDGAEIAKAILDEAQGAPTLPDLSIIELAVEYVRNREQLEKRKLTAAQFAKAVRLTYQVTLEEQTAGVSPGGETRESIDGSQRGKRTKAT